MAPGWLILEHRRVVDLQKRAGLVDNRDGALNADVNASLHASPISILFGNTNSAWLRRRLRIK
jgi:hypothetical protein